MFCWMCGTALRADGMCDHCDHPGHRAGTGCKVCTVIAADLKAADAVLAARPAPTPAQIKDNMPGGQPFGALGLCRSCGGRTYLTETGPWCPRPFCGGTVDAEETQAEAA